MSTVSEDVEYGLVPGSEPDSQFETYAKIRELDDRKIRGTEVHHYRVSVREHENGEVGEICFQPFRSPNSPHGGGGCQIPIDSQEQFKHLKRAIEMIEVDHL